MAANANIGYHISLGPENVWDNLVLVVGEEREVAKEEVEEACMVHEFVKVFGSS